MMKTVLNFKQDLVTDPVSSTCVLWEWLSFFSPGHWIRLATHGQLIQTRVSWHHPIHRLSSTRWASNSNSSACTVPRIHERMFWRTLGKCQLQIWSGTAGSSRNSDSWSHRVMARLVIGTDSSTQTGRSGPERLRWNSFALCGWLRRSLALGSRRTLPSRNSRWRRTFVECRLVKFLRISLAYTGLPLEKHLKAFGKHLSSSKCLYRN